MNKQHSTLWAAMAVICCFITGCKHDGPEVVVDTIYQNLLSAYNADLCYSQIDRTSSGSTVTFDDGSRLEIPTDKHFLYDCTEKAPSEPSVNKSTNTWYVGSKDTGIPCTDNPEPSECRLVYLYYTNFELCMFISNGQVLSIRADISSDCPLSDFCFLKKHNPLLEKDVNCFVIQGEIKGVLPKGLDNMNLIPSFKFNGKTLKVGGIEQKSGVNSLDFSSPVRYTATLSDGTTKEYVVAMEKARTLPYVEITTEGGAPILDKENYVPGSIVFHDPDCLYSNVQELTCEMGIRGRGNTTWNMPKKPWKVKLSSKQEVFGMPKNKNWALLANYSDKTLLRNITAMEISRIIGMQWTPEMRSVEVYLNGEYQGVYSYAQHKEVSKEKVNIEVVTEEDNEGEAVTGGYYIEIDGSQDEDCSFWTEVGIPIMIDDPEVPTEAQRTYIKQYFKDFETALYADNYASPTEGYAKYIDPDSFIKNYLIQELVKNVDGNLRKSTFITKERNSRMMMYHVWDFDIAFGNCNYFPDFWPGVTNGPEGWFVKNHINASEPNDGWYGRMFKDPAFKERVKEIWNNAKSDLQGIPAYIDYNVDLLDGAQNRNFATWKILDKQVWPNLYVFGSYDKEVEYLKSFYSDRLKWLDDALNSL